jgi:hypothetical protein
MKKDQRQNRVGEPATKILDETKLEGSCTQKTCLFTPCAHHFPLHNRSQAFDLYRSTFPKNGKCERDRDPRYEQTSVAKNLYLLYAQGYTTKIKTHDVLVVSPTKYIKLVCTFMRILLIILDPVATHGHCTSYI